MCLSAYWEYMLRLATGCTWGHGTEQPLLYQASSVSSSSQLKVEGTSLLRAGPTTAGCSGICALTVF